MGTPVSRATADQEARIAAPESISVRSRSKPTGPAVLGRPPVPGGPAAGRGAVTGRAAG